MEMENSGGRRKESADKFSFAVLVAFAFLFILNKIGVSYFLYYYWWWYDIPMHLFGGFAVALLAGYIFFLRKKDRAESMEYPERLEGAPRRKIFLTIFLSVLAVGIVWELYEFAIDRMLTLREFDPVDTLADIANDLVGASVGAWVFLSFRKKLQEKTLQKK